MRVRVSGAGDCKYIGGGVQGIGVVGGTELDSSSFLLLPSPCSVADDVARTCG